MAFLPKPKVSLLCLSLVLAARSLAGADFYVSPNGSSAGNGSLASPWNLATALSHPSSVKPGDTIWLRGGTYVGRFLSTLTGAVGKPIVLRQYPGERATIDGNDGGNTATIDIRGAYTWYWGFEVTNSSPMRTSATPDPPSSRGSGIDFFSRGSKLVNLVVHDTAQGVLTVANAPDAEVNGCLLYYNGYDGSDRGHGHGIYVQNETGTKRIVDNILFSQFGYGIHAYTEGSKLDELYFEGNTSFHNGVLSQVTGLTTNFLIGASGAAAASPEASGKVAKKTSLVSNYSYFPSGGTAANLGYSKGIASPTLLDNYLVGGAALALVNAFRPITMTGNTLYGTLTGLEGSEFPNNTYFSSRPTGVRVFVRRNQFEPGRANITVYNWDRAASVGVSLKGILGKDAAYEIRNAQNFFGPAVLSGTYDGSSTLQIPMNGLAPAAPVGLAAPPATGPEFQVFVVLPEPPASNGKPPVAAFRINPRTPVADAPVAFDDLSAGADSRVWDFGDTGSGASNTATEASPTHTYAAAGTYSVLLTVENGGGSSTRVRTVTVGASPGGRTATLPVVGHVLGATGTTFVSDVAIENPTSEPVSALLVFSPSGADPPLETTLSLSPGETRVLADVVASEFGVEDALGSLRVDTEGAPPAPLRVACRTYVTSEGTTLGLGTVGLSAADGELGDRYISNISISDAFRSNVGALNTSEETIAFTLQLRDEQGRILGRAALSLEPGRQQQWALAKLFPGVTGSGMMVRIVPAGGGVAPLAYAAVTDNASSDPTYYAALGPSPVQYVPGIAGIPGYGGAFFRSELSIANSGHGPATVTVTFLEHDRNNTTAPTSTFVLGPYETLHADDALQAVFGRTETFGAVKVESDASPGIVVFERILTEAEGAIGTVGQQMDSLSAENLVARGSVLGVRQDAGFRSNVGVLNPGSGNAEVQLTLRQSPATVLGTVSVLVPPRGYVQRNLASLFPSITLPPGEVLSLAVEASVPVVAFASVIDNVSQDPTFYPEQP